MSSAANTYQHIDFLETVSIHWYVNRCMRIEFDSCNINLLQRLEHREASTSVSQALEPRDYCTSLRLLKWLD